MDLSVGKVNANDDDSGEAVAGNIGDQRELKQNPTVKRDGKEEILKLDQVESVSRQKTGSLQW